MTDAERVDRFTKSIFPCEGARHEHPMLRNWHLSVVNDELMCSLCHKRWSGFLNFADDKSHP